MFLFFELGILTKIRSSRGVTTISMRHFIILFFILFCSAQSYSQAKGKRLKISKLGFVYQTFSGDKNKSLADGAASYGAELSVDSGGEYLRYFMKTKVMYSSGKQNFLDDTTEVKSNYNLTQIMPELGVSFYPVARKNQGLNLYLWIHHSLPKIGYKFTETWSCRLSKWESRDNRYKNSI